MSSASLPLKLNILLADDDRDDCLLFKEALEELELQTKLTTVHDGERLMQLLKSNSPEIFDVLFLDLNMPRKNGFTCLEEIKQIKKLRSLPVIIISTSTQHDIEDLLYKNGANHYIYKPPDFYELRKLIQTALSLVTEKKGLHSTRENFVLRSLKPNLPLS
jgi:CheY-like chemotaxis protein